MKEYLNDMSVEHIKNVQKIVDGMAHNAANMFASIHSITLLYPELNNLPEFMDIRQKVEQLYVSGYGMPIASWLSQFSRNLQATIDEKEKKKLA